MRIWFNRTYATNIHTVALLRDNPDGVPVRVYATHADLASPVMITSDVTELEPPDDLDAPAYVAWALDFCARHEIEVFVPRFRLEWIAAAREAFTAAGVAVVAGPAAAAALLDDKAAAYRDAEAAGLKVPPFHVVRDAEALVAAYDDLEPLGEVCLKPVTGVGGEGFRVLTRAPLSLDDVVGPLQATVRVDELAATLAAHAAAGGVVPPLMVLPFLPGPEVSVDCLADDAGELLAAVPRTKLGRERVLVDDPEAVATARSVVRRHRVSSLSNTQVRYWQHPHLDTRPHPYLLETNVRISGGLYQTALSGLNLPWAAVQLALGRPVHLPAPRLGATFTTVSSLVVATPGELPGEAAYDHDTSRSGDVATVRPC